MNQVIEILIFKRDIIINTKLNNINLLIAQEPSILIQEFPYCLPHELLIAYNINCI